MRKCKKLLALLVSLAVMISSISTAIISSVALTVPEMDNNEDISAYITGVLTYFVKDEIDTYNAWMESLETEADDYQVAIARLQKGIDMIEAGYTFYDDSTHLGNYHAKYEPVYYSETTTYYKTVSNPSGLLISLHKSEWNDYAADGSVATPSKGTTAVVWDASTLTNVKVEWATAVGGARTAVTNGEKFAVSSDIVLYFTVTRNTETKKADFLGALVGDGKYYIESEDTDGDSVTDYTTDDVKYARQAMFLEDYRFAPYKLEQTTATSNLYSAYQVVWGGVEPTRGDTNWSTSDYGYDYPFDIKLGANESNPNLIIKSFNTNGIRIYGASDTSTGYNQNNANSYSATMKLSHGSSGMTSHAAATAIGANMLISESGNWISLADAATYTKYWGEDADVEQIIPAGETVSEFKVTVTPSLFPVIIFDYVDAYNYSYLEWWSANTNNCVMAHKIVNGVRSSSTTLWGARCSSTVATGTDYYYICPRAITANPTRTYYLADGTSTTLNSVDLTFTWNDATNCYDLTVENWPLVTNTNVQIESATDLSADGWKIQGYASRTVSLSTLSVSGSQLSNIYLSNNYRGYSSIIHERTQAFNSTTARQFSNIAVKTEAHAHKYVAYTGAADESMQVDSKTCYSYAQYFGVCEICGQSSKGDTNEIFDYIPGGTLEHTWSEDYNYNESDHWKLCTVCEMYGHESSSPLGEHNTDGADDSCSVCGFETAKYAIKQKVDAIQYFVQKDISAYRDYMNELESVKDIVLFTDTYNRIKNAVDYIGSGYTFYDDGSNLGTYNTLPQQPNNSTYRTYSTTVTNPAGLYMTLCKDALTETVSGAAAPAEGQTAVYWDTSVLTDLYKVEYSTDGGATKTEIQNGVAFAVSGDIEMYFTLSLGSDNVRSFQGIAVSDGTNYYRQAMDLSDGVHEPYELDTSKTNNSPYQMIWSGIEATKKWSSSDTTNVSYDHVKAYSFGSEGDQLNKGLIVPRSTINGAYFGYNTSVTSGFGSFFVATGWAQYYTKVVDATVSAKYHTPWDWLTLADKAQYDAYYGTDSDVMQIVPTDEKISEVKLTLNPAFQPKIIYDYNDPDNYSYINIANGYGGNPFINVTHVRDGVKTDTSSYTGNGWGTFTANDITWNKGKYYFQTFVGGTIDDAINLTIAGVASDLSITIGLVWDEDAGKYILNLYDFPTTVEDGNGWFVTSTLMIELPSNDATNGSKQLTNIYIYGNNSASYTSTASAVAFSGVAVRSLPEGHKHVALGDWEYSNGTHYKSCECGYRMYEENCYAKDGYITENNQHWQVCDVCKNLIGDAKFDCTGSGYVTVDGVHQHKCSTCNQGYGETTECSPVDEWKQTSAGTEHYKLCVCGNTKFDEGNCVATETLVSNGAGRHYQQCETCSLKMNEVRCSSDGEWNCVDGSHWRVCDCGYLVNKGTCAAAVGVYSFDASGHWQICKNCSTKISGSDAAHEMTVAPTYSHGTMCAYCDYDLGDRLACDFAPTILGSKILKAGTASQQKLRIDIDFTSMYENEEIVEYGVIVAPKATIGNVDLTEDVNNIKELMGNSSYTFSKDISEAVKNSEDKVIMKLAINLSQSKFANRIVLVAYVKDDAGNVYYSDSDNDSVGLSVGVLQTSVMRVMKAVLKNVYSEYINTAVVAYYATTYDVDDFTKARTTKEMVELVTAYINGEITVDTSSDDYNDAVYATPNVFTIAAALYNDANG